MEETTFLERCKAAKDILNIMRWSYRGVGYYENKVYALRVWNEATVLIEASSEEEAKILAEAFNKVNIKKAREQYIKAREERIRKEESNKDYYGDDEEVEDDE